MLQAELNGQLLLEPGIYLDYPEDQYHALPYVSNSRLSRLDDVPAAVNVPFDQTTSMAMGSLFHMAVLEPDRLNSTYAVRPDFPCPNGKNPRGWKNTNDYKALVAEWDEGNNGRKVISIEDMNRAMAMKEAVMKHPAAGTILAGMGIREQTIIFDDEATGLRCKSRVDFEPDGNRGVLVDLKKTASVDHRKFLRSILDYGYARQAAFYLTAKNKTAGSDSFYDIFLFIACEDTPPYHVEVFNMMPSFLRWGLNECRRLLDLEASCRKDGFYPHYNNPGIFDMEAPSYLVTNSNIESYT